MAIAVGQITLVDLNEVVAGNTPPTNKVANETTWLDTSQDPPVLKVWDGTEWKKANDFQVGGVNILPNSNFENSDNPNDKFQWSVIKPTGATVEVVDVTANKIGFKNALHITTINKGTSGIYFDVFPRLDKNLVGKKFVLSGLIKYTNIVQGTYSYNNLQVGKLVLTCTTTSGGTTTRTIRNGQLVGTSDWKRFEYSITLPSDVKDIRGKVYFQNEACNGDFWITGMKLEEGEKATAWTPRYDDALIYTENQIIKTKAEIKIDTDGIKQEVGQLTTKVNTTENTVNGHTTKIEEVENIQNSFNTTLEGIQGNVSTIESAISSNLVLNGDFKNDISGWNKVNTVTISRSVYSNGTTWANMYASTLTLERYAYTEMKALKDKNHMFKFKLAQYNSTNKFYRIRLQYYNATTSAWVTHEEWTGNTEGTRANPQKIDFEFTALSDKYRIWVGKLDSEKFDIYVTDFVFQCNHDVVKKADLLLLDDKFQTTITSHDNRLGKAESSITQHANQIAQKVEEGEFNTYKEQTATQISSKVTAGQVSTIIEQNPSSVKVAWNNYSNYVQLEAGGFAIYNGTISTTQKRAFFDEDGNHFWRDGYYLGKIGTNQWNTDNSKKGIVFDLNYEGTYMTWASKRSSTDTGYYARLLYANKDFDKYTANKLYLGAVLHCQDYGLYDPTICFTKNWFEQYQASAGGLSGAVINRFSNNAGKMFWGSGVASSMNSIFELGYTSGIQAYRSLNMNGYSITNSSSVLADEFLVEETKDPFVKYLADDYSSETISLNATENNNTIISSSTRTLTPNIELCGTGNIVNGRCQIDFKDGVIYDDYVVNLTAIGRNTVYLMEKNNNNFVVEADTDCNFDYIVKFITKSKEVLPVSLMNGRESKVHIQSGIPDEAKEIILNN